MKIEFVVIDECNLGYINPKTPDSINILASSQILASKRGKVAYNWKNGPIAMRFRGVRTARRKDFETFRLDSKGYENDPAYDFPKE